MASDNGREDSSTGAKHPPSAFTDSKGNLKFVNAIVAYPCRIFFFVLVLCILLVFILATLTRANGSPFTEDSNEYDLFDTRSVAYDSLNLAVETVEETNKALRDEETVIETPVKIQEESGGSTIWVYEAKTSAGLFTKEALPIMRSAEMIMTKHKEYSNYCQLEYTNKTGEEVPKCKKPLSATNIFYASEWNSTMANEVMSELAKDGNAERYNKLAGCVVDKILCSSTGTPDVTDVQWVKRLELQIKFIVKSWDGEGELNQNVQEVSEFLSSLLQLQRWGSIIQFFFDEKYTVANPVAMYSRSLIYWGEPLVGSKEAAANNTEESEDLLKKYIVDNLLKELDDAAASDNNSKVQTYYFMGILIFDVILKILTADGLKAVASFLAVFFYLRLMIGSWFLAMVGMLEIVLSLPLAWFFYSYILQIKYFSTLNVLCIFIVMAIGADDIFVFMDAYHQSAHKGEEVLTSLESRISWVYRRSGHAMAITSATTCCAFLCTLISPIAGTRSFGTFAAFVILFDYVLVMTLYCTAVVIYHDRFESKNGCCNCTFWSKSDNTSTQLGLQNEGDEGPKSDRVTTFFKEKFSPFILQPKKRIMIAIPMIAWVIISSVYSSKLESTTTAEQFLEEDHPLQKGATILDKFPKTKEDNGVPIYFIWGLQEIDRDGVNQLFNPGFIGEPSFAKNFEFNEACQSSMLKACEMLKTEDKYEEFIKRVDGARSVDCFVEELGAYSVNTTKDCDYVVSELWKNETWQVSPSNLASTIESFAEMESCYGDNEPIRRHYRESMGWDGTALRYAGFSIESSIFIPRGVLAEDVVRVHYDKFIELKDTLDASMEKVCQSTVVMTDLDQKFVFMNNQSIYRKSAVLGSMLGVAIAFVVLFASTKKFHIALFASTSILLVLISVIGSITILGWTLGTIEAILISILAGFSVDYTVHLAHAYTQAEGNTEQRVEEAFADMGISVFSGMLTSVVASIPLFFCSLTFFAKFGAFLCLTIIFSWLFANLGFMSLLAQFKIPMKKKTKGSVNDGSIVSQHSV